MTISYDYRGLPVAFNREVPSISGVAGQKDSVRLLIAYDGAGSRISKIRERKSANQTEWNTELSTHYTGIGSEIRVNGLDNTAKVVVNLPQGLGRYGVENATAASEPSASSVPSFEWYLKNHLGSTMIVYGINGNEGSLKSAYDYRAFGEQVDLTMPTDKVTETFTGKELDDETELSYFGARYLDQMLGMWVSVDTKRQFNSPYLYAGNGVNPINGVDEDGNVFVDDAGKALYQKAVNNNFWGNEDIRREYEFANSTPTRISIKRQDKLIGSRELTGSTMEGVRDQINLINGVSDDYTMLEATVTLSNEGSKIWADELNITPDEAEARTAAHEFGAHIRGFSPNTDASKREQVEHDKYKDVDQRLDTPKNQCRDYE